MNQGVEDPVTDDQHIYHQSKRWFQLALPIELCAKSSLLEILYHPKFGNFPKTCQFDHLCQVLNGIQEKFTCSSVLILKKEKAVLATAASSTKSQDNIDTISIVSNLEVIFISLLIPEKLDLKSKLLSG